MITVEQFLKALAVVESSDDPEAWGDAGQAMGRWQVHPSRLWTEMHAFTITPTLTETWDQLVARLLRAIYARYSDAFAPIEMAMYWHVGHWVRTTDSTWDQKYAARFNAALANAQAELP
jgi:hypothetical protein